MQTTRYKSSQTLNLKREISQNKRKNQITKQECQKAKLQSFSLFPLQPCNIFAQTPIHRISRLLRNLISGSSIACQISSSLRTDHDVPPKDSIVTPKQESNIKDAAVARTNNSVLRFFTWSNPPRLRFSHQRPQEEKRCTMVPSLLATIEDRARLSSENLHNLTSTHLQHLPPQ